MYLKYISLNYTEILVGISITWVITSDYFVRMGTCAACYHGTRFSFHSSNSKYASKTPSLPFSDHFNKLFIVLLPITFQSLPNGAIRELKFHYETCGQSIICWTLLEQISSHAYVSSKHLLTPKKNSLYTLTIEIIGTASFHFHNHTRYMSIGSHLPVNFILRALTSVPVGKSRTVLRGSRDLASELRIR
jgi:hypothetical protein